MDGLEAVYATESGRYSKFESLIENAKLDGHNSVFPHRTDFYQTGTFERNKKVNGH